MYFIARGEFDIFVTDENQMERFTSTIKNGQYFGEVALIKDCKRTATVISKNYSTCAELMRPAFNKLVTRYPFIKDSMENRMRDSYNDKWKKFIKRCLRNIDYLSYGIPDRLIEEMSYMFELRSYKKDDYVFRAGTPCREIHIISQGEMNIYVHNNTKESFVDTLYTGCTIGGYSSLISEEYTISGKAKTDLTLLAMPFQKIRDLRETNSDLDKILAEYETYLDSNGLPYCDYKLYRNKHLNMTPIEKLRYGIKRIIRIVKSYRSSAFSDLMEKVREKIRKEKDTKESRRRSYILRSVPLTPEERTQQILIDLVSKVEFLKDKVVKQEELMVDLRKKIRELKCYPGDTDTEEDEDSDKQSNKNSDSKDKKSSKRKILQKLM